MRRRMVDRRTEIAAGRPGWVACWPMISFCTAHQATRWREKRGGGEVLIRHPLNRLYSGGGDGCREAELVLVGTGPAARPQGTPASGGDGCRRIAPLQA